MLPFHVTRTFALLDMRNPKPFFYVAIVGLRGGRSRLRGGRR